ncbi:MAG: hypothetical protein H7Z13_10620 [Ferruginibacter sp.]|nr:hypothetical protein [Ferruginibacter sp.]
MKIIFLCGSLEPGRDGVGDYTRRLAGEMIRQGHQAGIIALNDLHLSTAFNGEQQSDGMVLPVLRLPSLWLPSERFQHAGLWIDDFNPEWLSLQFVPFSFHPRGLTFGISRSLLRLGKNRKWHIMFHELWVGMHRHAPKKEVIWGYVQRRLIFSLITKLKPTLIHTQSSLYRAQIAQLGFEAVLLPLFSNIPITANGEVFFDKPAEPGYKKQKISMVLFGGIHKGGPVEPFAREVKAYSKKTGVPVSLIILGRGGSEQQHWEEAWKKQELEVVLMGEQSPVEISTILRRASYGITTTVLWKVEKSGSVAAMVEHGLKVICVAAPWQPRNLPRLEKVPGVMEYEEGKLQSLFNSTKEAASFSKVAEVSKNLVHSFTSGNH